MLNGVVAMRKLWNYLKAHRREKVKWLYILMVALCAFSVYTFVSLEEPLCGAIWGITALLWLYQAIFISDKERAMENEAVDDRPVAEKLREAFAGLTSEELQTVLDDDLRSEETKGIAGKMLKERRTEI